MTDPAVHRPIIHVVAAVLHDRQGRVLIAERPAGKPMEGFWEFPGGKIESGETPFAALKRELHEELGATVLDARPLIRFAHTYPERHVELDVWRVTHYTGTVEPREQQRIAWVNPDALAERNLLPADVPIIERLRLPPQMLVTPVPGTDSDGFLQTLKQRIEAGIELVQFRAPGLDPERYEQLAREVIAACRATGVRVILNTTPHSAQQLGADGVHLNSRRLAEITERPIPAAFLVGASCHNAAELEHAAKCGLDYAALGPVLPTATHPESPGLGWDGFEVLARSAGLRVFAIGGMRTQDMERIHEHGGYGLAAIQGLWNPQQ